ncbi:MAG: hypothetical protein HY590_05470 [Candidatus Omnitrophica bacterium]|nr:hypothetical protein [Candidatus Omnitrophota bacterium]
MASTKTITEQLTALLHLQEVDAQIYALMRKKNAKPIELQEFQTARDLQKQRLLAEEKLLTELQLKRKDKEVDLETKEGVIKKYQVQLYQIKTNKEYQSLQQEIESLKADNSVLEEEILKIMEEVDQRKAAVASLKEVLAAEEAKLAREQKRIAKEIEEIEEEMASLKEKRQTLVGEVEPHLLSRYERILVAKEGLALVSIDEISCLGCHMELPPQVINEVRLREKIITCENCARILYDTGEPS